MASEYNLSYTGYFDSEEEAIKVLEAEGRKLEKIAKTIWRNYLESYTPKEYIRTGASERAIKLNSVKKISEDELGIELTWENDLAWHDSWLWKKGKISSNQKGHAIILISMGWHAKKLEKAYKKPVYRHTYYEGFGYLSKVIEAYDAVRDKRIGLELQIAVQK